MSLEHVNQGTCILGSLCPLVFGRAVPEDLRTTPLRGKFFMFLIQIAILTVQRTQAVKTNRRSDPDKSIRDILQSSRHFNPRHCTETTNIFPSFKVKELVLVFIFFLYLTYSCVNWRLFSRYDYFQIKAPRGTPLVIQSKTTTHMTRTRWLVFFHEKQNAFQRLYEKSRSSANRKERHTL